MPKFTPGPWTYKVIPIWTPANPTDGIPCFECSEFGGEVWIKEAKINARLIAKAPEMYARLKATIEQLPRIDINAELAHEWLLIKNLLSDIDGE